MLYGCRNQIFHSTVLIPHISPKSGLCSRRSRCRGRSTIDCATWIRQLSDNKIGWRAQIEGRHHDILVDISGDAKGGVYLRERILSARCYLHRYLALLLPCSRICTTIKHRAVLLQKETGTPPDSPTSRYHRRGMRCSLKVTKCGGAPAREAQAA